MQDSVVRFAEVEWEAVAPHARQKVLQRGSRRLRLLEFSPGFEELEWCRKPHVGYVISGDLRIQFANAIEYLAAGDALSIESGESGKHKAIVGAEAVLLFLVE